MAIIVVLLIVMNVVWQVHMFITLAKTYAERQEEDEKQIETEKIESIWEQVKVNIDKPKSKFEVNNWRKMHGLIKKSKKTWKKGKRYGVTSSRRK